MFFINITTYITLSTMSMYYVESRSNISPYAATSNGSNGNSGNKNNPNMNNGGFGISFGQSGNGSSSGSQKVFSGLYGSTSVNWGRSSLNASGGNSSGSGK